MSIITVLINTIRMSIITVLMNTIRMPIITVLINTIRMSIITVLILYYYDDHQTNYLGGNIVAALEFVHGLRIRIAIQTSKSDGSISNNSHVSILSIKALGVVADSLFKI